MKSAIKKYPLYIIEWVDAQSDCDWCSPEKIKEWANKDCMIVDVGWVICETNKYVVVSSQIGKEDGELGNRTKIPIKWIKRKIKIKCNLKKKNT